MNFSTVTIGSVLHRLDRFEPRIETEEYHFAGTFSFGRGVFRGERKLGATFNLPKIQRIHQGDFVYCKIMAWEGAFGLVPPEAENCVMSAAFVLYEIDRTRIVDKFLSYYFSIESVWRSIGSASTGTNVRRRSLHPSQFEAARIPLPPLDEQRRIVSRIEALAAKIEEARGLRQASAEAASKLVDSEIVSIFSKAESSGWSLGTLGNYVVDARYGTSEKTNGDSSGTPILRMGNIQNGRLDLRDLKYLYLSKHDRETLLLESGDILVNRTNSAELVGKCAVFDLLGEYSYASYLICLRLDRRRAESRLVATFINSPAGRTYMFSERKQMTGQANVNATKLKALPISLPPLSEQRRILAELDSLQTKVDALKRLQAETAAELDALLPSILDKAFKGEL